MKTNKSKKDKLFYFDKCASQFTSKKRLKTHKLIGHELIWCENCDSMFKDENKLQAHMKEQHTLVKDNQDDNCMCTFNTVCDQCINYWAQKGHQGSQQKL